MDLTRLCFWHPVGPHGGESLEAIVLRKRGEIDTHGYTLWSFAPAVEARVVAWRSELRDRGLTACSVLCCGDTTIDPHDGMRPVPWMTESSEDGQVWASIPTNMTNYHRAANRQGVVASAFVVTQIEAPAGLRVARPNRWLRTNRRAWEQGPVLTRGEYLIERLPPSSDGRQVRLLLSLRDPFVVWLR